MKVKKPSGPRICRLCLQDAKAEVARHVRENRPCDEPGCPLRGIINEALEKKRWQSEIVFGEQRDVVVPQVVFGERTNPTSKRIVLGRPDSIYRSRINSPLSSDNEMTTGRFSLMKKIKQCFNNICKRLFK